MKTSSKFSLGFPWCAFALIAIAFALTSTALAQYTPTTLYTFPPNAGVAYPSGLVMDSAGNLYGTTRSGGRCGNVNACGTVFELSPQSGGGWTETTIFNDTPFGSLDGPLTLDAAGNLYGVISTGGNAGPKYCDGGCGMVFELSPISGAWYFTELFQFHGSDGGNPGGGLVLDSAGNLYGTTTDGGLPGWGTVYKLTPATGVWQHKILHSFTNGADGKRPNSALVIDAAGSLYGVADGGLNNFGVVFKLTPASGGAYHFQYIHAFTGGAKGEFPNGPAPA